MKRNDPQHAVCGSLALDISDNQSFDAHVIDYEILKQKHDSKYARHARLSTAEMIAQNLQELYQYGTSVCDDLRNELHEGNASGTAFHRFTPGQALAAFCILTASAFLIAFVGA